MNFNRLRPMFPRFFPSVSLLTLWTVFCLAPFAATPDAPGAKPLPTDGWKKDGLPFLYPLEKETISEIWNFLRSADAESPPAMTDFPTDFTTMRRQSRSLKGRIVRIEGRLLRTTFVPAPSSTDSETGNGEEWEKSANEANGENQAGYYDSWVLLDDQKTLPARILSEKIPANIQPDALDTPPVEKKPGAILYRQEQIEAVGVYYRQTAYSDGDDFYTAPTLVAETFRVLSPPPPADAPAARRGAGPKRSFFAVQVGTVVLAVLIWLVLRRRFRRDGSTQTASDGFRRSEPIPDDFQFDADALAALEAADRSEKSSDSNDDAPTSTPIRHSAFFWGGTLLAALAGANPLETPPAPADVQNDPPPLVMDLPFWETITGLDGERLAPNPPLTDEPTDARDRMIDRLERNIPDSALIANLPTSPSFSTKDFLNDWPKNFGRPIRFSGRVIAVEVKKTGEKKLFFVTLDDASGLRLTVVLPILPAAWGEDGVSAVGKMTGGIGVYFRPAKQAEDAQTDAVSDSSATLLAKRAAYYADTTSAGRLGADMSLFDSIRAISVRALSDVADPAERRRRLDLFRLTATDTRPFYGLLATAARLRPGALADEARRRAETDGPITAAELFHHPEFYQGEAVSLSGNFKRARKIPIYDPEIRACYGLDHYYELYLFTNDSQGYPVVCCTASLPDGFPLGVEDDYRQNGSISGIFYKPWGFKTAGGGENLDDLSSWIAVPLLIAGDTVWTPEKAESAKNAPPIRLILTLFFVLALAVWLYLRLRPKQKPLEFKVGDFPSDFPRQS